MTERLWNVEEVANFLGLAIGSVYHLVSQGRIPCVRLSARCLRFDPDVIAVWLQEKSKRGEIK
jgi:predicted DNA-binding transcriptional regulator AlpA